MPVAGVAGIGQQPFAARVSEAGEGEIEGAGGAIGDRDARCRNSNAIALAVEVADRLAQFRQAECLGVQRFAGLQGVDCGGDDRGRCREIRLADFHVDDVAALSLKLAGAGQQFDDVEGRDVGKTGGRTGHFVLQKDEGHRNDRWPWLIQFIPVSGMNRAVSLRTIS